MKLSNEVLADVCPVPPEVVPSCVVDNVKPEKVGDAATCKFCDVLIATVFEPTGAIVIPLLLENVSVFEVNGEPVVPVNVVLAANAVVSAVFA